MAKYAYVSLLYGKTNVYIDALVMGYTLTQTKTLHDIIMIHTSDVPSQQLKLLANYFKLIPIPDNAIKYTKISDRSTRFMHVMKKLYAMTLVDYDKICILDTDMIIRKNIDELFEISAPAGLTYNSNLFKQTGSPIPDADYYEKNVINAGVMILKPSNEEYNNMIHMLGKMTDVLQYPEEQFLSKYYRFKITTIANKYNYALNLASHANPAYRNKFIIQNIDDIYVIHYSDIKPRVIQESSEPTKLYITYETFKYFGYWYEMYNAMLSNINSTKLI